MRYRTKMTEICTRKKMAIAILVLIGISLVILIAQSAWSTHRNHLTVKTTDTEKQSNTTCGPLTTNIIEHCTMCSKLELRMEKSVCYDTGFKEKVSCGKNSKSFYRSCNISPDVDESRFWLFELVSFLTMIGSFIFVKSRQKFLDRNFMDKINKQIASGV